MKVKNYLALTAGLALTMISSLHAQGLGSTDGQPSNGVQVGEPVTPVEINVDLRNLPTVDEWKPGEAIREAQRRIYHPLTGRSDPSAPADWITAPDRLGDLQATFDNLRIPATGIDAAGRVTISNGSTGVSPGDPVVEVNSNYILYGINNSTGTTFTIYNKAGTRLSGPTTYKSLAPAGDPCATSVSDPIIHWDRLANRWFMLEMGGTSSANRLCVYISKTDNPVSGGWWFYGFSTPSVPDYPHCSVWSDSYVCATNEGGSGIAVYAFDRANMLNGATARPAQRFTSVPKLAGYGFQTLTPVTFMGSTAPPANAPVILARHNDDEAHAGSGANTSADYIQLYAMNINWNSPASSSISTLPQIAITEFNSWFRGYSAFASVPQPGSSSMLDPIREVILNSLSYRRFGSYESIVGNFATNQNAARTGTVVDAGVRWFELRKSGTGNWALHQEGTFSPGDSNTHHLLGAISQDSQGNIGMGYNVTKTSSPTVSASLRYTGRLNTDALGVMTQGENEVATGAAAETSGRWGDYYQMVVDPADDCTFWFVGMYRPSGSWATRATDFKFSNCGGTPPVTYTVSGQVTTGAGAAISGVTVSAGSVSTTTDASGNYSIPNLAAGSYTLTPSRSGYTFSPSSRAVTIGSSNVSGQNFTGTVVTTGPGVLANGVPVSGSTNSTSANSSFAEYTVAIPAGASNLTIATSGASGDVDLYVRYGAAPTLSTYDCRPYSGSGNESCPFASPSTGTYYVRVYGYATGTQTFTITASWTNPSANVPPTANFSFSTNNLTASFTDTSTDSDGSIASRSWNFGDGGTSTAANPSRTYAAAGTYTVSLTVTDNSGASNSISKSVTVTAPPMGNALSKGVPVSGSVNSTSANSSFVEYTVAVPAGASDLSIATTGASGDIDLYVRFGAAPTLTTYDCRPYTGSGNETCSFAAPGTGTYFIRVYGYATGTQTFTLTADWSVGGGGTQPSFFENQTNYNILDNTTIESPISVSGRTGNAPSNLQVAVTIYHTYKGDLKVDLIAPDGSVYVLHNRSGGSGDNIIQTFTVNASTEVANGTWKLRVNDNARGDTGYLDKWSLQF